MKRLTLLLAAALLLCLPAAAEGWSFGDSWEEAPSAYAGEWDADSAPAAPADEGTRNDAPAQDAGWEASSSATTMYVVNCSEYVNLRAAPDTASQVLAHIPLGEQVLAYGGEGDFYRVEYAGMRGYVHADYLSSERASFSMRLAADPGYARLDTSAIEAYASSEQVDQYGYYAAANANDADPSTAWAEGANGAGEGEWLSLFFSEQKVAGFAICAGYQRSADTYNANGRPADIRVSVAGESDCTVTLDDARGEQVVLFSYPVVTDYLSIEISSVYGGASNAYTCISDVRVLLAG
mgnify:CR=1 FL=1